MEIRVAAGALVLSFLLSGSAAAARAEDPEQQVVVSTVDGNRGWLGVSIQDLDKELAAKLKAKTDEGAVVTDVRAKSPAEKAGIKENDIIVEFNGKPIDDVGDLQKAVGAVKPGTEVTVALLRSGERKTVKATIGKPPKSEQASAYSYSGPAARHYFSLFSGTEMYGLSFVELNQQLGEYFGAPHGRGVLVTEVQKESEGEKAGFRAGDVIVHLGRETVEDVRDISEGLEDFKEGEKAPVEILRRGEKKALTLTVEENEKVGWNSGSWFVAPKIPHIPDIRIHPPRIERELKDLQEELRHLDEEKTTEFERQTEITRARTFKLQEEAKALQEKLMREAGSVRT
jgi:S1-C subfamily serine protease